MGRAVPLGHPDFGKAFPCRCILEERQDHKLARLQAFSNLGPLTRLTFDNLITTGRSPDAGHQERFAQAVNAGQDFALAPQGWVLLSGPSGCGKTHLAAAISNRCIENGRPVLFAVVPDLLDHLRAAYRPDSEIGYDDLFDLLRSAPVLVLDDLGVQSSTPWAQEKLFQIINHRYMGQLPTVFTTNLPLENFDSRLQSRLGDPTLSRVFCLETSRASGLSRLDALELPLPRSMTFKSFDLRQMNVDRDELPSIQKAYREALRFAQEPENWIVFAGNSGRGKTRLASAIANYCRDAGMRVLMVVVSDLLDALRSTYGQGNESSFDDIFERVRSAPLLVLDEFGVQSGTPWADEKLFQLLNYRYNARLATVFTTNKTHEQLHQIDRRLNTRLTDPQLSSVFPMGHFNFFQKEQPDGDGKASTRYRGGRRTSSR